MDTDGLAAALGYIGHASISLTELAAGRPRCQWSAELRGAQQDLVVRLRIVDVADGQRRVAEHEAHVVDLPMEVTGVESKARDDVAAMAKSLAREVGADG